MERRKDLVNNTASARFIFFLPCFKLYRMEPVFRFINRSICIDLHIINLQQIWKGIRTSSPIGYTQFVAQSFEGHLL
jgi:hypothetical protein